MKSQHFTKQWLSRLCLALLLLLGLRLPGAAQSTISTVAGDGTTSGTGTSTGFTLGVAVDPSGNIYVAGGNAHVVRRITPSGAYSTIAGTGTAGYSGDGGPATSATLNAPADVFVINNALYIADVVNRRIRKVDLSTGIITTVAGDGTTNITGSGIGFTQGVAADASGNIYVATGNGHVIRKITPGGAYSNFAGTGTAGYSGDGGAATAAQVNNPVDIFFSSNALYIADLNNRYIRKVDLSSNIITTVAGDGTTNTTGNGIGFPNGVSVDGAGNILVATGNGQVIRKITPGGVHSTVAGTGTSGFSGDGGPATSAQVASPIDMSALGNDIYIADRDNYRIRKVTNVVVTAPTVTTATAGSITSTSAVLGGNVTADGGATVTGRGVVYSTSNTSPTIGGSGVTQNDNGTGAGTFSETITGLAPGTTYYVAAYATNSAGTSYGSVLQFVTTPNAPVVSIPANGSFVNTTTSTYSGTAQAGSTVTLYVDGSALSGTVTANGSGNWSKTQPTALSQGSHTVYATVTINGSATSANSNTNTFTVDTTPPAAPVVTAPANGGAVATTTPTYAGTAEANSTVTIIVDGSSLGTTTAAASGNWNLTQPTALAQGSHTVRVTATDAAGNTSASSSTNTFTVDTVAPTVAISSTAGSSGGTTNTTPIPFTVTFSKSVTGFVQGDLTVTGGTVSGFSGSGSTYTFNVTPSGSGSTVTVNVAANTAQDAAGNGNTAATQFSLTYQAPTATVTSVTRLAPSPTATTQVSYRVVFSASVTGLTTSNFTTTLVTNGFTVVSGSSIISVSGSGTTYTVVVNTGTGNGTLRLDVANSTGVTPTLTNVPYTSGEQYTITKSFAAAPTLRIQAAGSASGNADVTAFVDVVQVLQSGTSTVVANGLQNGSFETNNVSPGGFKKTADGVVASPWSFTGTSGVSRNNSAFGSTAFSGDAVGVVQSNGDNNASISQNLAVPTGSYQVSFRAIQRNYTALDQRLNVFVNDVFVGNIQPNNIPTYDTFNSSPFSVTAPDLTATVSTTASSPTSTSLLPFSVSFSQSVGSTFVDSDVTVTGGTVTSGSFSGSGSGPYTFTVTPSGAGPVTVSLAAGVAQDANNTQNQPSNSVSVQFQAPTITVAPATLPNGTANTAYSQTLTASGGTAPYSYAITAGALPAGITLASNGTLSGTPATAGTYNFTVRATDASGTPGPYSGARAYTLTIGIPTITVAPTTLPAGTVGVAYSVNFSASGGTSPYTYAITAGALPAGMTLATGGNLSGTPAAGGSFNFTVTATDANGFTGSQTYTLTITSPTIVVAPATLPSGTVGQAYSQTFSASGGTAPYSYAITAGALPAGMTLTSNGTLSGTPTAGGNFTFTVRALDSSTGSGPYNGTRSYTLTIASPTIVVAPATLPNGTSGTAYSQNLAASGGTAPYSFNLTAGSLPNGLTLAFTGVLSGTPTQSGTFNFTVTATDASTGTGPYTGSRSYTVVIAAPATITVAPATLPDGTVGAAYSQTITASGGTAPYSYAITAGALPAGMTLTSNGTLSGTPTAGGSFNFTVRATDANGLSGLRAYTLTIASPTIVVAPATLPNGTAGAAYSQTITASGGTAPYSYAITSGALPAGLTLSAGGALSGTPTAGGSATFTVTATDASTGSGPYSGSRAYTLTISAPANISWTGTVSTDWFTAANWNPAVVPGTGSDVVVPASAPFQPLIASGTASSRALSVNSGATLTMSGGTLDAQGQWTNNGTFTATGGTVQLGVQTGSIVGSSTTTFWNLTTSGNAVNLNTSAGIAVRRLLTTNTNLNTNGNLLTLLSDANGTALAVNPAGSIGATGNNISVQRYIGPAQNPGPGYRHLSSPTVSLSNSQGTQFSDLAAASFTPLVNPNYNTSATPGSTQPFPNIFGYDQSRLATVSNNLNAFDKGFYSPSALSDRMSSGFGYTVNLAANQAVTFRGGLSYGDLQRTLSRNAAGTPNDASAGWQLLGNPYPSPYDYSKQADGDRQNLDAAIYVYQSTSQYAGQYRTILGSIGDPILPMGQAFFARVSQGATSGSIVYRNANRVTTYQNPTYQRLAGTQPLVQLTLQGSGSPLLDEVHVYFAAGANSSVEPQYDAVKLLNPTGLNLSTQVAGQQLAIDGQAELGSTQRVVPLTLGVPAAGRYTLSAAQLLNLSAVPVYLRDLLSGAVIDLHQQASYQFTISNAATLVQGRFELVFTPQQALATAPAALAQQVGLYPNPAKTSTFVELPASLGRQVVTATLVDAVGREVRTFTLPAQGAVAHQLDLHELPTGVYALRLTTEMGLVIRKLIVE